MTTTSSYLLKFNRACEHLEALKAESNAWIEGKPYVVVEEPNPDPALDRPVAWLARHRRFRLASIEPVPERFSTIVSDFLFNVRSALDNLAFALASAFTPNMTDVQQSGSEFPVFWDGPMDARTETRKIGCIAPVAQAVIKALQPHHRGHNYRSHPLWKLHELNRIDKHRIVAALSSEPIATDKTGERRRAIGLVIHDDHNIGSVVYEGHPQFGALIPDAILFRWAVLASEPARDLHVDVILPLEIAFGDGGPLPLEPVIPTLQAILDLVRDAVIAPLSQFL